MCKWGNSRSESFDVPSGMKQGGILSPELFAIYVDDLIKLLRSEGIGCHVIMIFLACIFFADLALLAPTRSVMQQMIDICELYCRKYCLSFNTKKTKTMLFGTLPCDESKLTNLTLNGAVIEYVKEWKYLGVTVVAGKSFGFTARVNIAFIELPTLY